MNRTSRALIGGGIVFVVLVVISLFLIFKPTHHQTAIVGLERGFVGSQVGIQGATRLNEILLPQEFSAVKGALSNYIRSEISSSIVSANIVSGTTIVNDDGSINFSVRTESPNKTFVVMLQRPNAEEIIFSVPGSNFKPTTLYPFGQ